MATPRKIIRVKDSFIEKTKADVLKHGQLLLDLLEEAEAIEEEMASSQRRLRAMIVEQEGPFVEPCDVDPNRIVEALSLMMPPTDPRYPLIPMLAVGLTKVLEQISEIFDWDHE